MPDRVKNSCEANFIAHSDDCSGFVRAVAAQLGVTLDGLANKIVDTIRTDPQWTRLTGGVAANQAAADGKLVIGGLKGSEQAHPDEHGHVVVVVEGPLNRGKYPSACWGKLGGVGAKDQTVNWAWNQQDRDKVTYAA